MSGMYSSLSAALEAAAISGIRLITLSMTVNSGRTTSVIYRRTFVIAEDTDADVEQTTELTAMTALLRQYGKSNKRHHWSLQFALDGPTVTGEPVATFIDRRLASWIEDRAAIRDTVPLDLVEQVEVGTEKVVTEVVVGTRRRELEDLNVVEVRKIAASLKIVGAWRTKKAELIDLIIAAEAADAS